MNAIYAGKRTCLHITHGERNVYLHSFFLKSWVEAINMISAFRRLKKKLYNSIFIKVSTKQPRNISHISFKNFEFTEHKKALNL